MLVGDARGAVAHRGSHLQITASTGSGTRHSSIRWRTSFDERVLLTSLMREVEVEPLLLRRRLLAGRGDERRAGAAAVTISPVARSARWRSPHWRVVGRADERVVQSRRRRLLPARPQRTLPPRRRHRPTPASGPGIVRPGKGPGVAVPEGPEGDRLLTRLQPGQWVTGQVRGRADFGVFVDVGGGSALVPTSGSGRWEPAAGSIVTAEVVAVDRARRRVTLSRRPVREAFRGATQVKGKARRTRTGWQIVPSDGAAFSALVTDYPGTSLDEIRSWQVSQLEVDGARPVRPAGGRTATARGRRSTTSKKKRRGAKKREAPQLCRSRLDRWPLARRRCPPRSRLRPPSHAFVPARRPGPGRRWRHGLARSTSRSDQGLRSSAGGTGGSDRL